MTGWFPDDLPQFTIPLPESYNGVDAETIDVTLDQGSFRTYHGNMTAAIYNLNSYEGLCDEEFGIAVNRWTCSLRPDLKVPMLSKLAMAIAYKFITEQFYPGSAAHKGFMWPYSQAIFDDQDGNYRPRGFCAAVRLLDSGSVATTSIVIPYYFGEQVHE